MKLNVDTDRILNTNRRFHDEVEAQTYDERMGVSFTPSTRKKLISELERVAVNPLKKEGKVVDVGAGTGNLAVNLATTGWYDKVIAVDISKVSLDVALENARNVGADIETCVSDMIRLPFDDNSVELIVGCAFLHHLPHPDQFLIEVHRVLKPGGQVVIIGEPTWFGALAINLLKMPLVLLNKVYMFLKRKSTTRLRWEHDCIDVHNFTRADVHRFKDPFEQAKVTTEGFLEPIIGQSILAPIRLVLPSDSLAVRFLEAIQNVCRIVDEKIARYLIPKFCRVSLKFSCSK
ncbi:class I SAM-dependent methyltransferase [uncultured Endozoicomonas sp.]|uniref:class I SAM-dependent methyltransferase n=1 Tax=uncultured Endozoicomonas sp. TaxID=432652 RepID=UPI00260A8456|nr:class I SAM-dependent methyltransferase [uncultured Endozoicomonas sp.]